MTEFNKLLELAMRVAEAGRVLIDAADLSLQTGDANSVALSGPAQRFIGVTLEDIGAEMQELMHQLKVA